MKLLSGFTVLDLGTFITAPYAAMLLAELGADVIKVERPDGGDPFRWFAGGLSSPHFQAHNRHKRSVALDCTTPRGLELLHALVRRADALVINVRPGVEKRLGIDEDTLRELNPKLVFCFITGFGADGPYASRAAYDNVGQALAGWLSRHHDADDARVAGPAISDAATGIFACLGIVSALLERTRTGIGRESRSQHARSDPRARDRTAGALFRHREGAAVSSARSDVAGLHPDLQGRQAHCAADVVAR